MSAVLTPVGRHVDVGPRVPAENQSLAEALQVYREGVGTEFRGEVRDALLATKAAMPSLSVDALGADPETVQDQPTRTKH